MNADSELEKVKHQGNNANGSHKVNLTPMLSKRGSARSGGLGSGLIDRGMILPFQSLCLTFSNINYYVPMPAVVSSHTCIFCGFLLFNYGASNAPKAFLIAFQCLNLLHVGEICRSASSLC